MSQSIKIKKINGFGHHFQNQINELKKRVFRGELFSIFLFIGLCLVALIMINGCAGFTVNGIPVEKFKTMGPKEGIKAVGGIAVSNLVHLGGHILYCEVTDHNWHMEGWRYEVVDGYMTDAESAWMGRAGFIPQLLGGFILNKFGPKESYFTLGYNIGTFAEISLYPVFEGKYSDLEMIDRNSNSSLEYSLYTATSIYLLDIKKEK